MSNVSETQPQNTRSSEPATFGYIALSLIFVGVVLFYRKPDALLNPQFWAEDGTVFFQGNYSHGLKAIFSPHAGYFQLLLRLIAFVAGWFPLELQPAVYNYSSLAITLGVVAKLFSRRLHLPRPFLLAAAVPLVTHTGEILLCLTNLHWITSVLLVLLLIQDLPRNKSEALGDLVVLFIVGFTGPHILFLAPLFVIKFGLRGWQRWDALLAATAVAIALVQAVALHQPSLPHIPTPPPAEWIRVFAWKLIAGLLFGWQWGSYIRPITTVFLLFGLVALVVWRIRKQPERLFIVTLLLGAGMLAWLSIGYRFTSTRGFFDGAGSGERYFFLPRLALVWSMILCIGADFRNSKPVVAILVLALFAAMADFAVPELPDLHWAEQISKARKGEINTVAINPVGWQPIQLRRDSP